MTADLAEEHSTATLATERLEAEQSERMRLEKEKGDLEVISTFLGEWGRWVLCFEQQFLE
jgi:hypothetical protein